MTTRLVSRSLPAEKTQRANERPKSPKSVSEALDCNHRKLSPARIALAQSCQLKDTTTSEQCSADIVWSGGQGPIQGIPASLMIAGSVPASWNNKQPKKRHIVKTANNGKKIMRPESFVKKPSSLRVKRDSRVDVAGCSEAKTEAAQPIISAKKRDVNISASREGCQTVRRQRHGSVRSTVTGRTASNPVVVVHGIKSQHAAVTEQTHTKSTDKMNDASRPTLSVRQDSMELKETKIAQRKATDSIVDGSQSSTTTLASDVIEKCLNRQRQERKRHVSPPRRPEAALFCSDTGMMLAPDATSKKFRKKVQFQLKENGDIKADVTVKSLCTMELSDDEYRELWWSKEERKEMKKRYHLTAQRFLATAPFYRSAAEQLLRLCINESGELVEWEQQRAEEESLNQVHQFSYDDAVRVLVANEVRGLEQPMVSALNLDSGRLYYKCGKSSIVKVLQAQKTWKKLPCFSDEQKSTMIAMQLRQYSGFAARFAQILAEGDAKFVRGEYDDSDSEYFTCEDSFDTDLIDIQTEQLII